MGRLSGEKAHRMLIEVAAQLVSPGRRVRLRLVEEGPDQSAIKRYIFACSTPDSVRIEGALNQ